MAFAAREFPAQWAGPELVRAMGLRPAFSLFQQTDEMKGEGGQFPYTPNANAGFAQIQGKRKKIFCYFVDIAQTVWQIRAATGRKGLRARAKFNGGTRE